MNLTIQVVKEVIQSHQTRSTDRSNNYQDRRSNNRYQRRDRDNQKTNWDKPNSPEIEDITPQQSTQEMTEKFKQKSQLTGQGSTENPLTSEPLRVDIMKNTNR